MTTNYNSLNLAQYLLRCVSFICLLMSTPLITSSANAQTAMPSASTASTSSALRSNGKIAFTSDRDGNQEIYLMNSDGTAQIRLTTNPGTDNSPSFSPDGSRIAFVSEDASGAFAIKLMDADGTNQVALTPLAYRKSPYPWHELWSMSWSPDGGKLAFEENGEIFTINLDGSGRTNLTNNPGGDFAPAWSPDGSRIMFASYRVPGVVLHTMNPDGSDVRALPTGDDFFDTSPDWSPAGDKIVFIVNSEVRLPIVYTANADGTNRQPFEGCFAGLCSEHPNKPKWSPDGKMIVFHSWEYFSNNAQIYRKNIDGSGSTRLTYSIGNNFQPSWQPLVTTSLIDDVQFFVSQHYVDFLNREPDAPGLAHWVAEINECNDSSKRQPGESLRLCRDRKRANTSAAFFLSPEFQNSGSFVLRVYWGALGKLPSAPCAGLPSGLPGQCRPLYGNYVADMNQVAKGIVVNDQLAPEVINANKRAFVEAFVNKPEFKAIYDSLNNQQFVDQLFATTGITPTDAERSTLVSGLNTGTETRSSVVFKVVDGTQTVADGLLVFNTVYGKAFYDQEFDAAFVFMEYAGYLQRNPDQAGYEHWLGKLKLYGNWQDAQMVLAFISSPEYRSRFGQP